ncbi:Pyridoxal phosphate-dependent transferase, major region, subdomain 1 [Penicillium griseofulvum]|uniref:Pyridoxal phosphate-dependent transferase, major region, subdomain 1 n=1 Tax=Penicillium patulum TaxID=5078 RepID=A0A135LSX8_PENPA|nr:Pyridoxal phosphate-dependent transferase, major region, subdomain 1 [Penicillium griseofulvum]KXG52039.1 Pyridoxal phosphate-dependent transferase, major region, subdomain 1 [Penicillium griseofulvum]
MTTPERLQTPVNQTRLIQHFEKSSIENHNDAWSNLWDTDNSDMWDRGKPSPALIDLLEQRGEILNPIAADGRRKKAFVPGCGKGYDVVMLALHGFDVVGLEISQKGVSIAEGYASSELDKPQAYNFGSAWENKYERGSVSFVNGDFFQPDAMKGEKFDVIYDYTFLCAIHPTMRAQWASRMAELLVPGGLLVCLEFPLFKDPSLLGPPWPLQGVHWNLLSEGGDGILHPSNPNQQAEGGKFERKCMEGFGTRAIRSGLPRDVGTGALVEPIVLATTFAQDHVGSPVGFYVYGRSSNPNRESFEISVAEMESAKYAVES